MLQAMDKTSTPTTARSLDLSALLHDRATLEGVECVESGWEEWDSCVAEQDFQRALAELRRRQLH